MSKFKIGERVVALVTNTYEDKHQECFKGQLYVVNAICYCMGCGVQCINTGNTLDTVLWDDTVTCDNGSCRNTQPANSLEWGTSTDYASIDDVNSIETAIEESVKTEDYETAMLLRDFVIQNK